MNLGIIARIDYINEIPKGDKINYIKFITDYLRKKRELVLIDWRDIDKNLETSRYLFCNKEGIHLKERKTLLTKICDSLFIKQLGKIHKEKENFLNFLDSLEKFRGKIINPPQTIKNNLSKQYLLDFQEKGFPIIPTIEIKNQISLKELKKLDFSFNQHYEDKAKDLVVKPKLFGEQGFAVRKLSSFKDQKEFKRYLKQNSPIIVQPLIKEISEKGENSLIFLKEKFIHGVNKFTGKFKINCCEGIQCSIYNPSQKEFEISKKILDLWPDQTDYMRIDLIPYQNKALISEIEVVNPAFYIENVLELKDNFAKKLEDFFYK